jgi:hypothetical protein
MLTRLLLALSLILLGGCTSTRPPKLTVTSAALTERTADGMVLTFTVEADNMNPDPLPLRDVTYQVTLDGHSVFGGVRSAEATVRRFGTQSFTLPAAVPLSGPAPEGTVPYTIQGSIKYLVPGALAETLFDIHVIRPSTDFAGAGVVDLSTVQGAPAAPPPAPPKDSPITPTTP